MEWTSARVRTLRDLLRLTREEFADLVGAAPKSVQNWETGAVGTISHYMQRSLDSALEQATPTQQQQFDAKLQASAGGRDGGPRLPQEDGTDRRGALRTFGALAGGLVASAHLTPGLTASLRPYLDSYLASVELDRRLEASDLGPETLRRLDQVVEHLGLAYLQTTPDQTLHEANTVRLYVVELLDGRHTLAQRTHLYAIAGWLSALIGHASFDLGHDDAVVDGHCATALHLAREARHDVLAAWVRGTQALAATFRGRPDDGIVLAQAGLNAAPRGSAVAVRLHAQHARAHARLGDQAAVGRALVAAERDLDQVQEPLTTSIFSFAYPYLPFYGGTCYTWLGHPGTAVSRSQEAIALCDAAPEDWPVARVLARIDLAEALVQDDELDGATQLADACLDICTTGRRTDVIAGRLAELLTGLRPRLAPAPARELDGRYREAFAGAAAGTGPGTESAAT